MTLATVRRLVLALPGVEEGVSYGTPGFRVRGKFLARLWEDGGDSREVRRRRARLPYAGEPETFFVTEHYRGYPPSARGLPGSRGRLASCA